MHIDHEFKIEAGIPMPNVVGRRGPGKTPLRIQIEALFVSPIGTSLFVPASEVGHVKDHRARRELLNATARAAAGGRGGWAISKPVAGGYRVWKYAEPKAKA